jgi:hypothetical protein
MALMAAVGGDILEFEPGTVAGRPAIGAEVHRRGDLAAGLDPRRLGLRQVALSLRRLDIDSVATPVSRAGSAMFMVTPVSSSAKVTVARVVRPARSWIRSSRLRDGPGVVVPGIDGAVGSLEREHDGRIGSPAPPERHVGGGWHR